LKDLTIKMTIFLQSLGSHVANVISKPFVVPDGDEDTWSNTTNKKFEVNVKAIMPFCKP